MKQEKLLTISEAIVNKKSFWNIKCNDINIKKI